MTDHASISTPSRLPHRLATVLVCAVFPLIWIGGLVTSSEAGMAVPDWPNTYGYNLFLYPWQTWLFGPWDIFVEHGHRLLGAAVGMFTIALAWALRRHEKRRWLVQLGFAALALVIIQGVLGGMRVVLSKQLLAMIHGCVGPLYFAVCTAIWQFTSPRYASSAIDGSSGTAGGAKLYRLALLTTALAYIQLTLGALVRHVPHMPDDAARGAFRLAVLLHLFMAAVLTIHIVLAAVRGLRFTATSDRPSLRRPSLLLLVAIVAQLGLGSGAWLVNYGAPEWLQSVGHTPEYLLRPRSWPQILISTAHVAVGSLILVTSLVLALRAKLYCEASATRPARAGAMLFVGGLFLREAAV